MTLVELDGHPPFELPPAHRASAWPTTEGVKVTFHMVAADGNLHPVCTVLSGELALNLADSLSRAARKLEGRPGWLTAYFRPSWARISRDHGQ